MQLATFFLLQFAILAYAFVGGVFLAFSDFILRALSVSGGAPAMQAINREVFRWVFMALFLGMVPLSLLIAGYAAVFVGGSAGALMIAAALVYVIGCFGVTAFGNVPLNNALAQFDAASDSARSYWIDTYLPRWSFWNTLRTVACALAASLMLFGLVSAVQAGVFAR